MASAKAKDRKKSRESWGAVRRLPSGRYQASYTHHGKRYNAPHPFDTIQDARAFNSSQRVDIQRGVWRDPDSINKDLFGEYAREWVRDRESNGQPLRDRTRLEYARQLSNGLAQFEQSALSAIDPARVRAWHSQRKRESGATSAAREAALLRAIMSRAVKEGAVDRNPVDSSFCRSRSNVKHRMPTLDELAVMVGWFNANEPRLALALLLAAYGGLRMSEWRGLRRGDLILEAGRVTVKITRQVQFIKGKGWTAGDPKSAEGLRSVPLPKSIVGAVETHLTEYVGPFPQSLLFASRGRSVYLHDSQFKKPWDKARTAAGIAKNLIKETPDKATYAWEVREHDLRHFHLSHYATSGATLAELKARAGHSTNQAAMGYQHAVFDRGGELADAMPSLPNLPQNVIRLA